MNEEIAEIEEFGEQEMAQARASGGDISKVEL